jgi:hypothetical protein
MEHSDLHSRYISDFQTQNRGVEKVKHREERARTFAALALQAELKPLLQPYEFQKLHSLGHFDRWKFKTESLDNLLTYIGTQFKGDHNPMYAHLNIQVYDVTRQSDVYTVELWKSDYAGD